MKTQSLILSAVLLPIFVGSVAYAAPRKYTNCTEINQIKSPPNSAGFFMSEDCKTAYVLPPAVGAIGLASYVDEIGSNGEMCSTMNGSLRDIDQRKKSAAQELKQIEARMSVISNQLAANQNNCLEVDRYAQAAADKLATNQTSQTFANTQLQQIDAALASCTGAQCDDLRTNRIITSDKLEMLKISEETLQSSSQRYSTMASTCHANQTRTEQALNSESTQHQARTSILKASMASLTQAMTSLYEGQRSDPGGMMSITISSEQTALVKKFRELNANLSNVQFMEMPLSDVSLSFTQIKDGVASGYPTLLKANINGVTVNADNSMTPIPFSSESSNQTVAFGAAVGGSLTINRFAACQLPSASDYGSSSAAAQRRVKDIAGLLTGTATYRYQLGVSRKIKIHYNEKQLYCLIKKQSSSSGLFRSSSSTSITETSQLNQWLSISVESEDTGFDYANRETLLMDLREEMLDRALMKVATSYLSKERAQLVAPEAPRADGMANELRKCPNLYCQAGALVLNLGSALFGGTSSSSSTCENVGASSDQDYIDTKPVSAYGTQAFSIKPVSGR
jgi:hypothetical protein